MKSGVTAESLSSRPTARGFRIMAVAIALLGVAGTVSGCNRSNPETLTGGQIQGMDRQEKILRDAGGDWNKVSAEDRTFLIQGMGSEESAKQYVQQAGAGGRAPEGQYGPPQGGGPPPGGGTDATVAPTPAALK